MSLFKKAWLVLSYKQKKYSIFIFIMMFFAMILETLSVGIVLPLFSILLKGDIDTSFFSYIFPLEKLTGNNLIYAGLLIALIFGLLVKKNLFFSF